MKIEGPGNTGNIRYTGKVSRTGKTTGAGASSFVDELGAADGAAGASGASATSGVARVDQLVGLQEVDDALTQRKAAQTHGKDILDQLDELRLQLLDGRISKEKLIHLARTVSARKAAITDPHLLEILDEIDLRAQVEIAKFMRDNG